MTSQIARLALILLLAACCASEAGAAAQGAFGAQLGVERSGIDGDTPPNTSYSDKTGWIAGVQGELRFKDGLSLSLQPSYVQKKSGLSIAPDTRGGSPTELSLSFDYFSIPAVVKFSKAGGRTYVAGGFTADFMSAAKLSGQGSDRDVKSTFNSTIFNALLGFGVVFPVGRMHLTTEVRYVQGLTNLPNGGVAAASGALAARLHSNGLELIVGDLLPFGGK